MSRKTKKPTECSKCGAPDWFRCMTCDRITEGGAFNVALGDAKDSTTVSVCKDCMVVIRSYESLRAMEAGDYNAVFVRGSAK